MSEQAKLDKVAAKARAEYVIALFAKDDYDHTRLLHLIPALAADVLALLPAPTPPTTPASAARDALVAACVAEQEALENYERDMGYGPYVGNYAPVREASNLRIARTAAYRKALTAHATPTTSADTLATAAVNWLFDYADDADAKLGDVIRDYLAAQEPSP